MSIQGSINSLFSTVLGAVASKKIVDKLPNLKNVKTEEDAAKYAEKVVPELRKKDPHIQGALIREARQKLLQSTAEGRKQLQLQNNFNTQSVNQSLAQKGVQQINQRNALQQRFEQVNMFDKIDKQKQLKMNIGE